MFNTSSLTSELTKVQSNCIGIFKKPYGGFIELVVECNESTFTTIYIGKLLGLQESTYPLDRFENHINFFSEDKTKTMSKFSVYELNDFCIEYKIN